MAVCQYFLRGQCRFGDSCRNDHPGNPRSAFGNQSWSNPVFPPPSMHPDLDFGFSQDSINTDLTSDKPLWPLSTYGPAKYEPNLISGLDESSEELRVRAVQALKAGNVNEYTAYESSKIQAANQTYGNARNNLTQVYQTSANQSPHNTAKPTPSAFPSTAPTTTSAFGQTGFTPATTSAFGQPLQPPQSAFNTPSTTTVAGAPAGAGAASSTAGSSTVFGGMPPSSTGATTGGSVFGQSAFTQQQQPQSVFGQTTGPSSSMIKPASGAFSAFAGNASSSPFAAAAAAVNQTQGGGSGGGGGFSAFAGQPSAFGAGAGAGVAGASTAPAGTSAFGQPAVGAPVSVFGQPQQQQQQPTSAFGNLQTQPTSVFGGGGFGAFNGGTASSVNQQQPQSAFGGNIQQPPQSVFGQTSQPQSAFGTGGGAFGGGGGNTNNNNSNPLNPLNAPPTSSSVFTPLSNQSNNNNPLNAPNQNPFTSTASTNTNPFQQQQQNPFTNTTNFPTTTTITSTNPITNPNTRPDFSSIFEMVKGKYKPGTVTPYDALLPSNYVGLLPEGVVEAFKSQVFEFGKVPDWVPPVEFR